MCEHQLIVGTGLVVGAAVSCLLAGEEGERDFHAERAALVASVVPESARSEASWENFADAVRAVAISRSRIAGSLRLRHNLPDDTALDLDPLLLIGASREGDAEVGPAGASGEDNAEKPGENDAGAPESPDVAAIELRGVRTLMRIYEENRLFDRMTVLRLRRGAYIAMDRRPLMLREGANPGGVRATARLEGVRMWRYLEEGEGKKAAEAMENLLALGEVLSREPTIAGRLMSIEVIAVAGETLRRRMVERGLDAGTARDMLGRLQRRLPGITPMTYTLKGERLTGLDTIARVFDGEVAPAMVMEPSEVGVLGSREENEARMNELYDAVIAWAAAPAHARREIEPSPAALAAEMPAGLVLTRIIAPGLEHGVWLDEGARVEVDGLLVMLALEAHRAEHAAYPETLGALVPGVLAELPRDEYAPDGRYRYRRVGEGKGHPGQAYVLYGVGYDGEDNGGVGLAWERAAMALRPGEAGRGSDFVINRAPPGREPAIVTPRGE